MDWWIRKLRAKIAAQMSAWRSYGLPGYSRGSVVGNALVWRPLRRLALWGLCRTLDFLREDRVTVLIPVRDRFDARIEGLLRSLRNQTAVAQLEIVVIDFGSRPDCALQLQKWAQAHSIQLVREEGTEWNRSQALNAGLRRVRTKYVLISDVDLLFDSHYVARALAEVRLHPLSLAVAPMRDLPKGFKFSHATDFLTLSQIAPVRFNRAFHPSILFGRTQFFRLIGGYEEYYRLWGVEDDDMMARLNVLGLNPRNIGQDTGYFHQWHPKYEGIEQTDFDQIVSRNRAYFQQRAQLFSKKVRRG